MQRQPDISLAYKELNGWEPKVQLKEGLRHTIEYFDNLLKKPVNSASEISFPSGNKPEACKSVKSSL